MKTRIINLAAFLLLVPVLCFSKAVSLTRAKIAGYNYLHQRGAVKDTNELVPVYTSGYPIPGFYIFNALHAFVIVAADDIAKPVLAYSYEGIFRADHMPSNLTSYLDFYDKEINYGRNNHIPATNETLNEWSELINNVSASRKPAERTTSTPLLGSIKWDQGYYYDADCPKDFYGGVPVDTAVTGCTATAMAQVMKYWNWPAHGYGIHSYPGAGYGVLTVNFGATTYNWAAMTDSLTTFNAAVATLMYNCGVGVNMEYSPSGSGAWVTSAESGGGNCAEFALKAYFSYDSSLHGEARSSYTNATWISLLKTEIDAGRPVIYDGYSYSDGHCFVFDDYDVSNNFHVNWGWSGLCDGYYSIDALDPTILGIGGGGGGFNANQSALFGVKPGVGITIPVATASLTMYDDIHVSPSAIPYVDTFRVTSSVFNMDTMPFFGDFCAKIFDTTGVFYGYVDSAMGVTLLPGAWAYGNMMFRSAGLASLTPGRYQISYFYRTDGTTDWIKVPNGYYTDTGYIIVTDTERIELADFIWPAPVELIQSAPASFSTSAINISNYDFNGNCKLVLLNLDSTLNSTIQVVPVSLPMRGTAPVPITFTTSSVTAAPGSYYLAASYYFGAWWLYLGSDYYSNFEPITVISSSSVASQTLLNTVKIFPNPATDDITVDLSGAGATGINATLWDMHGRKVYDADATNQSVITIPVRSLAAGMYMLQVATDAGMINKKITVSSK